MSAKVLLFALLLMFTNMSAQTVVSQWNNYASVPADGKFLATAGIASNKNTAILTRDANVTSFTVPSGGIASSAGWALDRYWEVTFETIGYENLTVTSRQMGSSTGPSGFKLQYSVGNSEVWTDVSGATTIVVGTSYANTINSPTNLSLPVAVENQASVSLRWVCTSTTSISGGTVGASGTNRLDVIVSGTAKGGVVDPVINTSTATLRFTTQNITNTKTFSASGINLSGLIQMTSDNPYFFITPSTLPATGGEATVRFIGATSQTGKITLQSGNAKATVDLIAMLSETGNDGTKEHPFNVTEGTIHQSSTDTTWVKGYIVGAVKANTATVTASTADSVLIGVTSGFNSRTNVLIADNINETDYNNCMVVELQSASSSLRTNVNLVDHPENVGKLLNVKGKLRAYFGLPGSRDNTGNDYVLGNANGLKPSIIPELNVYAENGTIFVVNLIETANIRIYDLTGKLLIKTNATEIPFVQRGLYIVKVNNQTFKVINKF